MYFCLVSKVLHDESRLFLFTHPGEELGGEGLGGGGGEGLGGGGGGKGDGDGKGLCGHDSGSSPAFGQGAQSFRPLILPSPIAVNL